MGLPLPSTAAINTFEPAILFAVLYTVLALLYIWRTAHNPAYPFIVLVIFCVFRVVGFILRAILATSDGAKENSGLVITETIFFTLGFVGILYSLFILISDRTAAVRHPPGEDEDEPPSGILALILSRRLTDLTFTAAAAVSIAAAAYLASDWDLSERLRKVAILLYLGITIRLSIHAAVLVYREKKALEISQNASTGHNYEVYMHCPILFFLLIRQTYLLATFSSDRQYEESLWYPLFATPEFLAACFFFTPGLVPRPEELPEEEKKRSCWVRLWRAYNSTSA